MSSLSSRLDNPTSSGTGTKVVSLSSDDEDDDNKHITHGTTKPNLSRTTSRKDFYSSGSEDEDDLPSLDKLLAVSTTESISTQGSCHSDISLTIKRSSTSVSNHGNRKRQVIPNNLFIKNDTHFCFILNFHLSHKISSIHLIQKLKLDYGRTKKFVLRKMLKIDKAAKLTSSYILFGVLNMSQIINST